MLTCFEGSVKGQESTYIGPLDQRNREKSREKLVQHRHIFNQLKSINSYGIYADKDEHVHKPFKEEQKLATKRKRKLTDRKSSLVDD